MGKIIKNIANLQYIQNVNKGINMYSKVFIIRPGCSGLLEFEKKVVHTGSLRETFSKYPDQVVY